MFSLTDLSFHHLNICIYFVAIFTCRNSVHWQFLSDKTRWFSAMCTCLTYCESVHFFRFLASLASFRINWLIDTFSMFWGALVWFSWENWSTESQWKGIKIIFETCRNCQSEKQKIEIKRRQIMINRIRNKSLNLKSLGRLSETGRWWNFAEYQVTF